MAPAQQPLTTLQADNQRNLNFTGNKPFFDPFNILHLFAPPTLRSHSRTRRINALTFGFFKFLKIMQSCNTNNLSFRICAYGSLLLLPLPDILPGPGRVCLELHPVTDSISISTFVCRLSSLLKKTATFIRIDPVPPLYPLLTCLALNHSMRSCFLNEEFTPCKREQRLSRY